ncbi:MAG: phospholipase D family protein [Halioglobus sp.]
MPVTVLRDYIELPQAIKARLREGACVVLAAFLAACAVLPEAPVPVPEAASKPGPLGAIAEIGREIQPEQSSFHLLPAAEDAMHWRLALIDSAVSSIDIQYFIWKDDASGSLMLEHVFAAADRGVKVRMMIDDMFLSTSGAFEGADETLAAISYHPNIAVRLFNPGKYRSGITGLAGNFGGSLKAYNRRMHNKMIIFDGLLGLVGGRNIGDEYFGLHEPYNFLDLDLLAAGTVVSEASEAFVEYWNSDLAYPATALMDMDRAGHLAIRKLNADYVKVQSLRLARFDPDLRGEDYYLKILRTEMHFGFAVFLQDEPVLRGGREYRLADMLSEIVEPGSREVVVSSPYLIPVGNILDIVREDVEAGVEVRLLTNSLASNDEVPAHSHYKKYRQDILATGARLYEFHHQPAGDLRKYSDVTVPEGNIVALHTKAYSVDGERCYVGSLNIDPRSIELNTENGIYIESKELCGELSELLNSFTQPENAWSVTLDDTGKLRWQSYEGTTSSQPALGLGQRISDFFFRILPIESQL